MTTHARFVGAGVQPLVDAVKSAGGDPGDLRSVVWQATWARGYDDVVAPAPAIRLKEDGFVVYSRIVDARRYAAIVDTGHALWALVTRGTAPPPGARVRIVPAFVGGEIGWEVTVVEVLGLGLSIRFAPRPASALRWAEDLRETLENIAEAEIERRRAIVTERRSLVAVPPVKPFREELDALAEQLRQRVDAETAATADERVAFDRANEKQRKAIIEDVKVRRVNFYNAELKALRARVPELQAAYDKRVAASAESRAAIAELEDAASRSRSVSERIAIVQQQLKAVDGAGLFVECDPATLATLGPPDFPEISRTVELLYDLIPRRGAKRAAL